MRMETHGTPGSPVEIEAKLKALIAKTLKVSPDKVTSEAGFKADLGADSLDLVLLLYEIEDQMGIALTDDDAKKIVTVGDALRLASQLLAQ
jgi:acyl carrier protein